MIPLDIFIVVFTVNGTERITFPKVFTIFSEQSYLHVEQLASDQDPHCFS